MSRRLFISLLLLLALLPAQAQKPALEAIREPYRPLAELLGETPAEAPTAGNTVEIIRNGEEKLSLLVPDMMAARSYIHMEYFEFFKDLGSLLVRMSLKLKALDSLEVRYLEEDFMNFPQSHAFYNNMRKTGVEVGHYSFFWFNRRNHQKIVTIDDAVAYVGGMNIGNHYFHEWDDTHLRLTGPCVKNIDAIYGEMWERSGGKPSRGVTDPGKVMPVAVPETAYRDVILQESADEPEYRHITLEAAIWLLDHCQDYLYIQTPYFTPPPELRAALKRAAARGLDLILLIPEKTDIAVVDPANRSYYRECVEAGVRIFETHGRFDHTKSFVADDYLSGTGSANLDGRSLKLNYENFTYFYDAAVADDFKQHFLKLLDEATEVTLEEIDGWSAGRRLGNSLARILAPQL